MVQPSTVKRRLKPLLNEIVKAFQIWDDLNNDCFTVANSLVNTRLKERYVDHPELWPSELSPFSVTTTSKFPDLKQRYSEKLNDQISELAQMFVRIFDKMETHCLNKLHRSVSQVEMLYVEACNTLGPDFCTSTPKHYARKQTYVINGIILISIQLVNHVKEILTMYAREIKFKHRIVKEELLSKIKVREEGMVLLSSWLNQPSIDIERRSEIEEIWKVEMEGEEHEKTLILDNPYLNKY
ncbi:12929_t:CDS:2 [Ambispora gerdemannii]|uniref:12929_t:CDS:1 n=1 Tax=Ambispora gerdemannii TaxID=144530 RepID=A0A9N8Z8Q0_9GLOM|nr:12929_t:CDS:2 [Ambispora gerdemannii]